MKFVMYYLKSALGEAWARWFGDADSVQIVRGDICETSCDAIVSPANSFGFMDGGLDWQLSEKFGWDLQAEVQQAIRARPLKELLVGEAIIVSTGSREIPWLISAPTMRVPMNIKATVNAYLAMKAILAAVAAHGDVPPIRSVAIPGLGTGVGGLEPESCASQMYQAYKEIIIGDFQYPADFSEAQYRHRALNRLGTLSD